ncbi:MAG: hypothetical protein EOP38_23705 [Rubrivivax sp.]|nr:MAG: hypothetical protein EOP38_23705 [Rubrivivax sp.]
MTFTKTFASIVAALAMGTSFAAQAEPSYFVFQANAKGNYNGAFSGPVRGTFSFDESQVGSQYDLDRPDGSKWFVETYDYEHPTRLLDWTLHGDYSIGGEDVVTRRLLPDGSSSLTLESKAYSTRGEDYLNLFTITYTSSTDILYTHRSGIASVLQADGGTGEFHYHLARQVLEPYDHYMVRDRQLSFTVISTAVPEPESMALVLAGLAMLPWIARRPSQRD